jgi:hypothetical protein
MASPTQARAFALVAGERPISIRAFAGRMILAGLANAAIAALLFFRLPASQEPSLHSLFLRALVFVAAAALAGLAAIGYYWRHSTSPFAIDPRLSFRRFALVNAEAWVWVPAFALLSRQDSLFSAALSALSAALLAIGLRRTLPQFNDDRNPRPPAPAFEEHEIFSAILEAPPREAHGYVIAFALYLTGYLLVEHFYFIAGIPLALGSFIVVWKLTLAPATVDAGSSVRPALRLASVAAAAVLVTFFVLLIGIGHRNRLQASSAALARASGNPTGRNPQKSVYGISGYESIVLWTPPEKKQIVAPQPAEISPFATRAARPIVIRFDGAYWYFQPPDKRPGPRAHQAHGTPIAANIGTNNDFPLTMEAVQSLSAPIRIAPYREIALSIENWDNMRGSIVLAVLLTDTALPGELALSLGGQPILSTQPAQFSFKSAPTREVLRFPIPARAAIRKFDQITVLFLPDAAHFAVGPKIAIQQFALIPR